MGKDKSESEHDSCTIAGVTREDRCWVSGFCGTCKFEAKVYDTGSGYGINDGRVSKLSVWYTKKTAGKTVKITIVNYDRGWDIMPKTEDEHRIFSAILAAMEALPQETSE